VFLKNISTKCTNVLLELNGLLNIKNIHNSKAYVLIANSAKAYKICTQENRKMSK